jgi:hypothetical protein
MLEDALARLESEIEPVELGVALLQQIDHAQRLQVVLEAAVLAHAGVQRILPGVAERRVAEVVRQRHRFDQVLVQVEQAGDGAADLRHFQAVGQPRAEQVALVVHEHLGLVFQAAERGRMDDAVAVALELGARRGGAFGVPAPAGLTGMRCVGG